MPTTTQSQVITCPSCNAPIDVNEIVYHQLREQLQEEYADKLSAEREKVSKETQKLLAEKQELEKARGDLNEKVASDVKKQLAAEKQRIEKQLRQDIDAESGERIKAMREELEAKSSKLKELGKTQSELERIKREKDELKETIEAAAEKKLTDTLAVEREKIRKTAEEKNELKLAERDQLIADLKKQAEEAQRKAEQGSMQIQGEVQELAIESWLREAFPLDEINEIKKGAAGADCLQLIHTPTDRDCGSIYYESKRTKAFSPAWIEKFKADMRAKGANLGVLVTEAMPKGLERMGLVDGVWVCSFEEFKGLCAVLRESVIQINSATAAQENKGDKMHLLYDFLTGNEFKLQVEAIVEGFTQMKTDLDSEKRAFAAQWKKREKQIEKVLLNTIEMHSSIKGIAGSAIPSVPQLEMETANSLAITD
ncbi:MAG: DUF2130 domain-containing protein [Verrucomicrobiota bacterium]